MLPLLRCMLTLAGQFFEDLGVEFTRINSQQITPGLILDPLLVSVVGIQMSSQIRDVVVEILRG